MSEAPEATTFPLFPHFPKEIRLEIWDHAIEPRILDFECDLYHFDIRHAPDRLYLVGGDWPYTHFEIDVPQRPPSPYYILQCGPFSPTPSPALLSVCRESRKAALQLGYRTWTIHSQRRGARDIVWNPDIDFVSLQSTREGPNSSGLVWTTDEPCLKIFVNQFPDQVKQIRRLVIHTGLSLSVQAIDNDRTPSPLLFQFARLVDLAIAPVDFMSKNTETEARELDRIKTSLENARQRLLDGAEIGSDEYRALGSWYPPTIRLVGRSDVQILGD